MTFFSEYMGTIITGLVLFTIVAAIILKICRDKNKNRNSGCHCSSSCHCGNCN